MHFLKCFSHIFLMFFIFFFEFYSIIFCLEDLHMGTFVSVCVCVCIRCECKMNILMKFDTFALS